MTEFGDYSEVHDRIAIEVRKGETVGMRKGRRFLFRTEGPVSVPQQHRHIARTHVGRQQVEQVIPIHIRRG